LEVVIGIQTATGNNLLGAARAPSYAVSMADVADHYQRLLADCYSWMLGDFEARAERERAFLDQHGVRAPGPIAVAVDLGAGSGHQSVALARLGWRVRAIDTSAALLAELGQRVAGLDVVAIQDDLTHFARHLDGPAGAIVCMGDTLTHLPSAESVRRLFVDARAALAPAPAGTLVLTYRDLSRALDETDRFIPVRADDNRILTCFLEYLPEVVRVHDLLYTRTSDGWRLDKSWYPKLRLAQADVERWLGETGFTLAHAANARGVVEIVARVDPRGS
jgi:SAM-dependent methyltransferase